MWVQRIVSNFVILIFILSLSLAFVHGKMVVSSECKDIIAVGNATAGNYNLLLKVRDPSRPGPQVLCIIPAGYKYSYSLPSWRERMKEFEVKHAFIGVVTKGDSPPNIVKPGIALSDAGIAYGDADSPSYWINPSPNAWDDFDWIRYACQSADNEDDAVEMLTVDAVDKLHAPAVSENLFVVGPKEAYVIEADAVRYNVKKVNDICVMTNYPKELWKYRITKRIFIANSFDTTKEENVKKGSIIHLGALLGTKVVDVSENGVTLRLFPFGKIVSIKEGKGAVVSPFWIEVSECNNGRARIKMMYKFNAWEQEMKKRVMEHYGKITVQDMMNWSRLHSNDLNGLRGMCERENKAAAVCKVPYEHADKLSCMWFSPDQCSSIFIPVHICCRDVYEPYKNGDAAELSKKILRKFGHGGFSDYASIVERVLIREVDFAENVSKEMINRGVDISDFMTSVDMEMQKQAFLTEKFVIRIKDEGDTIPLVWSQSYEQSLMNFAIFSQNLEKEDVTVLGEIAKSIARLKYLEFQKMGFMDENRYNLYENGMSSIDNGNFREGFLTIYNFLTDAVSTNNKLTNDNNFSIMIIIAIFIVFLTISQMAKRIK